MLISGTRLELFGKIKCFREVYDISWTSALKLQEFIHFACCFPTSPSQEVKLQIQSNAEPLAVFYEKPNTELQEKHEHQSLPLAHLKISQEQLWLFNWSLAPLLGWACCTPAVSRETWLAGGARRQPLPAGCALQRLCQPPWLSLPPPQPSSSLCWYLQNATGSTRHCLRAASSLPVPRHPSKSYCLQTFFLPCCLKGGWS